jgi:hypothetical protein
VIKEGSGPTARDTSGRGNDGTRDNDVDDSPWVAGRFGGGLAFNGQTSNRQFLVESAGDSLQHAQRVAFVSNIC